MFMPCSLFKGKKQASSEVTTSLLRAFRFELPNSLTEELSVDCHDKIPIFPRGFGAQIARSMAEIAHLGIDSYTNSASTVANGLTDIEAGAFPPLGNISIQDLINRLICTTMKSATKIYDEGSPSSFQVFGLHVRSNETLNAHYQLYGSTVDYTGNDAILVVGEIYKLSTKTQTDNITALRNIVSCCPDYTESNSLVVFGDQETVQSWLDGLSLSENRDIQELVVVGGGRFHCMLHFSDLVARLYGANVMESIVRFLSNVPQTVDECKYFRKDRKSVV
jgi:hypothetical protein